MNRTYNKTEFAALLGVHVNTVSSWLTRGKLSGTRNGRDWKIAASELERISREWQGSEDRFVTADALADALDAYYQDETIRAVSALDDHARAFAEIHADWSDPVKRVILDQGGSTFEEDWHERFDLLATAVDEYKALEKLASFGSMLRARAVGLGRETEAQHSAITASLKSRRAALNASDTPEK